MSGTLILATHQNKIDRPLVAQLQLLLGRIATFETQIEGLVATYPDVDLVATLPAAAPNLAPRLFVAIHFGQKRLTKCTAKEERPINLLFVLWHSSGFGLSSVVGQTGSLMMR
jgi:hypothetical protein